MQPNHVEAFGSLYAVSSNDPVDHGYDPDPDAGALNTGAPTILSQPDLEKLFTPEEMSTMMGRTEASCFRSPDPARMSDPDYLKGYLEVVFQRLQAKLNTTLVDDEIPIISSLAESLYNSERKLHVLEYEYADDPF
jgi:hypothetical protein